MENQNDKIMSDIKTKEGVMNQRRKLLLGVGAMAVWHKPIVNAVVLPAHAQTSMPEPPPTPAELCPMIIIGNVTGNVLSGTPTSTTQCGLTFDVLSGTAGTSLNITAITTPTLPADTMFSIDALGTATNTVGPRINWRGLAVGAPSACLGNFTIINDLTFTVTATCDAAEGGTFSQDFTISDLIPPAT